LSKALQTLSDSRYYQKERIFSDSGQVFLILWEDIKIMHPIDARVGTGCKYSEPTCEVQLKLSAQTKV
jgi:hypothetical protein